MKGCLGSILSFIFALLILMLIIKSGIWIYFKDVFFLLIDLIAEVLKGIIDIVKNGFTPPDYNQLFNY